MYFYIRHFHKNVILHVLNVRSIFTVIFLGGGMFKAITGNIRNQILIIISTALAVILAAVFWGFASLNTVIDEYSSAVNTDVNDMVLLSTINVKFKTQVQEWKNTLIRGNDPEQLNKYWGRFLMNGEDIQHLYRSLLNQMSEQHPARPNLQKFADAYPPMLEAYKRGHQAFIESGFDVSVGDRAVKGIDREPTRFLTEAVEHAESRVVNLSDGISARANGTKLLTWFVTLLATIASITLFIFFAEKRIIRPLNRLTRLSREIARGDFTHRPKIKSHDQIGQLMQSFVLIQRDLGGVVKQVLTDLSELTKLIDSLFNAFHEIKDSLEQQIKESDSLKGNMNQMLTNSKGISHSINNANDFVKDSVHQAHNGISMFEENLANSQNTVDATQHAAQIIEKVKQDSDEIGNVVNVINSIAEQTNLLALNAAIEAARAGENGRGFAVVADEVRSLATKTQESTTQISATIAGLQTASDRAVEAMHEGQRNAEVSLEQAKDAQEFMLQLEQAFEEISHLNENIEQSAKEQVAEANTVNVGLEEINKHSEQSQHAATVMEDASRVLSQILQQIQTTTSVFKLPEDSSGHKANVTYMAKSKNEASSNRVTTNTRPKLKVAS